MTVFNFPDSHSVSLEEVKKIGNNLAPNKSLLKELEDKYAPNIKNIVLVNSELTVYLEDTLLFMQNNNLIPDLPQNINIKYINTSKAEVLFTKLKDLFGKKPYQYNFPACTNIYDGTIYVSNHYQTEDYSNNAINQIRQQFTGDAKQALEYSFFHELGHLFLIEKNKDTINKQENVLFKKLMLNMEESFAESFAIHMMCLKYPDLPIQTKNFKYFEDKTFKLNENMCRNFYFKKTDRLKKPVTDNIKEWFRKTPVTIDEIFHGYEFPLIYKNSPFKDDNGNLITDMNIVFEKCFESSLKNNRQVIIDKINNPLTKSFKEELVEALQIATRNPTESIDYLIESFHTKIKNEGFLSEKINGIRKINWKNIVADNNFRL